MKKEYDILSRYVTLLLLIYFFISSYFLIPITNFFLWISYYFLQLITTVEIVAGELLVDSTYKFLIIEACIAPSAYMFIAFIFLGLPIPFLRNISLLSKALLLFTSVNLLRILFLMWIHVTFGIETFDTFHYIFYEGVSGILTAGVIIFYLRKDHIKKTYPLFTDVKDLIKDIRKKK